MRHAIVYVSRSGHSRALAEALGGRAGASVVEIGDLVNRRGLIGFLRSGSQAQRGAATPIKDPGLSLAGLDAITLVTPVWASSLAPPLRTWLKAHAAELAGMRLGLLGSNKGSEPGPFRDRFEAEFGPLAAFALVREKDSEAERSAALDAYLKALA